MLILKNNLMLIFLGCSKGDIHYKCNLSYDNMRNGCNKI